MRGPSTPPPTKEELEIFSQLIDEHRYDFERLAYIIFPFGEKDHELEHMTPYEWQIKEWRKLSYHLMNPLTRFDTYRLIISSGNGAAKTAFGAMTMLMLLYTQRLRARITANTQPQMSSIVWPEIDVWFRRARFSEHFFEKLGTSIKSRNERIADSWRVDAVTWSEQSPASISGLHNKGGAVLYIFEEAPGIPANIWNYASGAFTETETIKLFFAFGNSDDPESKFEQNMGSPGWHSLRIDTRTLKHIDQGQVNDWLQECGGNEDHDDFRVRVRGLPRKTSKDAIISLENVDAAIARGAHFEKETVKMLPVILGCDPAWRGGDETVIWYKQGNYACLLERYKLDKDQGQDHMMTYNKLCSWERTLRADAVHIDQGEGTGIYTLANNAGKVWTLVSFAQTPNDQPEFRDSQYANLRAQMYYQANEWLMKGGCLDSKNPEWLEDVRKQLCWTKGGRHKINLKKLAEPKLDIKARVGQSPDLSDGFVLLFAYEVFERLPENDAYASDDELHTGQTAYKMPGHGDVYDMDETEYDRLYN